MADNDRTAGHGAFSNAERQARYRARRLAAEKVPVIRPYRAVDRRSRPRRWHDAVAELLSLQAEYMAWLDGLPVSLHGSATAEALQAVADLDLEALAAVDPPRGYGRDGSTTGRAAGERQSTLALAAEMVLREHSGEATGLRLGSIPG